MSDALLIAAHGSRDEAGVAEFWALAEAWQGLRPDRLQAAGFLEFARPTIGEAIDQLVAQGAKRIVVVPAMLMAAGHVKNDVPSEIQEGRARYPWVSFHMARALDIHPALLELCQIRYREALAGRAEVPAAQTLLLLVGRGTSDPDANANIARVSRFLWESYGVGWAGVAFSGLAAPSVEEALGVCRRMGFARIVVQPYFLFDGILLKRIYAAARRHAELDPAIEILATAHFRLHPLLLQAFEDRAFEALHGTPLMNCDLCKYRVRLIGREMDLGAPQVGHHHHVRAAIDDDHDHDHDPS
ncbi:MAG: sirohydrochlorin chelatase, partial [Isosphaeraceae bacterium]|nr:sirohydrochlorin chelatase [Isosphaeraceae bacterium]